MIAAGSEDEGNALRIFAIGMIASHSSWLRRCARGRISSPCRMSGGEGEAYVKYYGRRGPEGECLTACDEVMMLKRFPDVLDPENQDILKEKNTLFVPNRSFTSYCGIDAVEDQFTLPLLGSRNLLRSEERGDKRDYYWLLEKAGLPI